MKFIAVLLLTFVILSGIVPVIQLESIFAQSNGDKKEKGILGPMGPAGPQGEPGPMGPMGPAGPQGDEGPQGEKGDTGATGPMGAQGDAGSQGAIGPIGPQGQQGDTGAIGATGPQGPPGSLDFSSLQFYREIRGSNVEPFSSVTLFIPCMGGDIAWDLELEKSSDIEINKQGANMIPPNPPDTYVVVAENKDNMLGSFGASAICLDIP